MVSCLKKGRKINNFCLKLGWGLKAPAACLYPVSYTHLTLPTSDLV